MKTFKHSGDIGDIIYSLPTIKALGGGVLYLNTKSEYKIQPKPRFGKSAFDSVLVLLQQQTYLKEVKEYNGEIVDYDLDIFRLQNDLSFTNLAQLHCRSFGIDPSCLKEKWIDVSNAPIEKSNDLILINKTTRYLNNSGDWKSLQNIPGDKFFVGLREEWEIFVKECFPIEFLETEDLYTLACFLKSCDLFIGNQSSAYAIAEAMKIDSVLYVDRYCPNCLFERENVKLIY